MITKVCKGCGEELPLSDYHKKADCKHGVRSKCKRCRNEEKEEWRRKNPDLVKAQNARDNKKKTESGYRREYYQENKEKIKESKKKYLQNGGYEKNRKYIRDNGAKYAYHCSVRRARIKEATSDTADMELIRLTYEAAKMAEIYTGKTVHVDHIIPLSKGGLHHQDNLQLLYKEDNLAKSDKVDWNGGTGGRKRKSSTKRK